MLEIRHEIIDESYSTRDAYNDIYSSEGILHRDSLYLWLLNLLEPQPGKVLLDIACGEGRMVQLAHQKGLKAFGTDFAFAGLYKGSQRGHTAGWFVADGECLPVPDGQVDYVTHIGSLEHYMNPQWGAREIGRVLKPGGKACILLPNAFSLFGNIQYVASHGDIFDDGQPLQRYATRRAWGRILEAGGLKIDKVIGYHLVVPPARFSDYAWLLRRPKKVLRFLVSRFIPVNLCDDFVFLCSRHGA